MKYAIRGILLWIVGGLVISEIYSESPKDIEKYFVMVCWWIYLIMNEAIDIENHEL